MIKVQILIIFIAEFVLIFVFYRSPIVSHSLSLPS